MDDEQWKRWQERERDPNAIGSRAWHRGELEAANEMVGMGVAIIVVGFVVAICIAIVFAF